MKAILLNLYSKKDLSHEAHSNTIAFALVFAVLAPTFADACAGHRKPVKCTSYTNINGTTSRWTISR